MVTYNIRLDETKPGSQCALQGFRVGEGGVRSINIILHSASVPVTIPADALAFLHCKKPDSTECVISTTVESSIIRIGVTQQMCASEGTVNCELKVYNSAQTQVLYSALFDIYVQEALSESGIVSSNEYSGLSDVMNGIRYVFIKYADAEPTQDSDIKDTPSAWLGVYVGTSHTAPTAYTSYQWQCIVGSGIKGDKGDKGDTGAKGGKGDTGAQGLQGIQGVQGETGAQGLQGIQGIQGETGATGAQGEQGIQGEPGAGVPTGGSAGQALIKASATDRDTVWGNISTDLTAALTIAGWMGSTAPYTQTVNVSGITAAMTPIIDIVLSTTQATAESELSDWAKVSKIETGAGSITATCFDEKPSVALNIVLKVVS